MADLSDASFTNVNDVETAQGAPVSEAVAQKLGSNENNLNTRLTTAESDIATLQSTVPISTVTNIGVVASGSGTLTGTTSAAVTCSALSVSGNIMIVVGHNGARNLASWYYTGFGTGSGTLVIKRDSTTLYTHSTGTLNDDESDAVYWPICFVDTGASGSTVYSATITSNNLGFQDGTYNLKISAFHIS